MKEIIEITNKKKESKLKLFFENFACKITDLTGQPVAFILAFLTVIVWAITGPIFKFSDTWQLVINTGTTIITFLMVFLIQQAQNKDSHAIQLKLNEIVAALKGASNRLINIEDLSEDELRSLKEYYGKLSDLAEQEEDIALSHSVEEAQENQHEKMVAKKAA